MCRNSNFTAIYGLNLWFQLFFFLFFIYFYFYLSVSLPFKLNKYHLVLCVFVVCMFVHLLLLLICGTVWFFFFSLFYLSCNSSHRQNRIYTSKRECWTHFLFSFLLFTFLFPFQRFCAIIALQFRYE